LFFNRICCNLVLDFNFFTGCDNFFEKFLNDLTKIKIIIIYEGELFIKLLLNTFLFHIFNILEYYITFF
jgi:hypothetical protein